ncbi:tyrosine-type recombinase/integrase [Streptomyces sp. NPDC090108]|uniref:tyrosine-type recombinase/integrase n=1 Tax=Streptomyces sp. NPDC090108 TaxID=3365947 RepID=UPI0038291049
MAQIIDNGSGSGRRWTVRYREPGGRSARQREKSFERKRDATDFATKVENDKREGVYIDPAAGRISVRKYAEEWLDAKEVAPSTAEAYERIMRLHVIPHLGGRTIAAVTTEDIEKLYAAWRRAGASPNTMETRRIPLSGLFAHATRHRRIRESPVINSELPSAPSKSVDERALPSRAEITLLADAIGPRLSPAVWLMALSGLRIGEALGVFSEDIQDGILRVRRQVIRTKGSCGKYEAFYAPLKHRKEGEWRDVPIPESFHALVPRLPIVNNVEGMVNPDLVRKSWNRAIHRLGLPAYTPHDLRHKWATVTLSNGVPIHEVSRWMGHRTISVTVDLYGHVTQDGADRCREVVRQAFDEPTVSERRP